MELHLLVVFILLTSLASVNTSYAATSSEAYWKSMLPGTPMPKVLHDLLPSEKKSDAGEGNKKENSSNTSFQDNAMSFGMNIGGFGINVGNDGAVSLGFGQDNDSPLSFTYAPSNDQLMSIPNEVPFFLDKDLRPGTKIKIHLAKTGAKAKFLPREFAERIPFSSSEFSEILQQFAVKSDSSTAELMKKTIKQCEQPAVEGEDKYCAKSLEGMVDFSISKLGKNVRVIAAEVNGDHKKPQEFSITKGARMVGDKIVSCHPQQYLYPVFYCHEMHATRAYLVSLAATDDVTKANAAAVCHTDTSKWNPDHLAFHALKVQPGSVPICHFLPEDHIVWVAN
ncbi:hypothetical protein Tsubulata_034356 [Turnera subulata]|uniref:BURP domain-containing protein n=1 Tax=Turnera subulata TaxID=218843 RepID=A0A9Q0J9L9_9ROSI|nr:hypothetical protein Tsubulata_034356 [Turnera subulata]